MNNKLLSFNGLSRNDRDYMDRMVAESPVVVGMIRRHELEMESRRRRRNRERLAIGLLAVSVNVACVSIAYWADAPLLYIGGVTFLPLLWMAITGKPLFEG